MEDKKIQTSLTEEIPEWKLKLAYFYAEHKVFINRARVFVLFFIDIIIVFLLGAVLINYQTGLIADENKLRQLPLNLVNPEAVKKHRPEDLILRQVRSIWAGGDKYHLLVIVKNNNSEWTINKLDYTFQVNGQNLETRTTFVLPKSEKYLMYFNVLGAENADLKILNTGWQKVKDFSLLSYKDGLEITQAVYKQNRSEKLSGQVEFTIFNNTPYGFWEVGLPIMLYNDDSEPIGIDYIIINKLLPKEKRQLSTSWHEPVSERVRQVEVYPEINLLDKGIIMELGAPTGSPPGLD